MSAPKKPTLEINSMINRRLREFQKTLPSGGATSAAQVSYNNSTTGMAATQVQAAIDELFTNVSNGKVLLADAITDKGVTTSPEDTFQTMADNIGEISGSAGDYTYPTTFTSNQLWAYSGPDLLDVYDSSWSPDGKFLFMGCRGGTSHRAGIRIYENKFEDGATDEKYSILVPPDRFIYPTGSDLTDHYYYVAGGWSPDSKYLLCLTFTNLVGSTSLGVLCYERKWDDVEEHYYFDADAHYANDGTDKLNTVFNKISSFSLNSTVQFFHGNDNTNYYVMFNVSDPGNMNLKLFHFNRLDEEFQENLGIYDISDTSITNMKVNHKEHVVVLRPGTDNGIKIYRFFPNYDTNCQFQLIHHFTYADIGNRRQPRAFAWSPCNNYLAYGLEDSVTGAPISIIKISKSSGYISGATLLYTNTLTSWGSSRTIALHFTRDGQFLIQTTSGITSGTTTNRKWTTVYKRVEDVFTRQVSSMIENPPGWTSSYTVSHAAFKSDLHNTDVYNVIRISNSAEYKNTWVY